MYPKVKKEVHFSGNISVQLCGYFSLTCPFLSSDKMDTGSRRSSSQKHSCWINFDINFPLKVERVRFALRLINVYFIPLSYSTPIACPMSMIILKKILQFEDISIRHFLKNLPFL